MGCSLIGPALWRGWEGGKLEREETDTGGEEKKRRGNDWTFVCLAARAHMSKLLYTHLSMDRDM